MKKRKTKARKIRRITKAANKKAKTKQGNTIHGILSWTARTLSVIVVLFWAFLLFSSHPISQATLSELVVLGVLVVTASVAWVWPRIGGTMFLLYGLMYAWAAFGKISWSVISFISTPMIVTGLLFLLSKVIKK